MLLCESGWRGSNPRPLRLERCHLGVCIDRCCCPCLKRQVDRFLPVKLLRSVDNIRTALDRAEVSPRRHGDRSGAGRCDWLFSGWDMKGAACAIIESL
jgi:hypothetical protein